MIGQALMRVFKDWTYVLLAVVVAILVFIFATWLANLGLVWQIIIFPDVSLLEKSRILIGLVGSIRTNFTVISASYTTAIAVLFGLNTAMVIYYMKVQRRWRRQTGGAGAVSGLLGLTSGALGIGCAACGTFVLGPFLSLLGGAGYLGLLPFGGQEFGLLGVAILVVSLFLMCRSIAAGEMICSIPQQKKKII